MLDQLLGIIGCGILIACGWITITIFAEDAEELITDYGLIIYQRDDLDVILIGKGWAKIFKRWVQFFGVIILMIGTSYLTRCLLR